MSRRGMKFYMFQCPVCEQVRETIDPKAEIHCSHWGRRENTPPALMKSYSPAGFPEDDIPDPVGWRPEE